MFTKIKRIKTTSAAIKDIIHNKKPLPRHKVFPLQRLSIVTYISSRKNLDRIHLDALKYVAIHAF